MSKSYLSLEHYWFDFIEIRSRMNCDPVKEMLKDDYDHSIGFDMHRIDEHNTFMIPLRIEFKWKKATNSPYELIDIGLCGVFSLPEEMEEEAARKYVPLLCLTNLYGIARGVISQMTANFPFGPFLMPLINMNDVVENAIKNKSEEQAEKKGKSTGKRSVTTGAKSVKKKK